MNATTVRLHFLLTQQKNENEMRSKIELTSSRKNAQILKNVVYTVHQRTLKLGYVRRLVAWNDTHGCYPPDEEN